MQPGFQPNTGFNQQSASQNQNWPQQGQQAPAQNNWSQQNQQRNQQPGFQGNQNHVNNQANNQSDKNRSNDEKKNREDFGRQYNVFSGNAAVQFYEKTDKDGNPTINIEAAGSVQGAQRKYDWNNKVTFQFMQHELGRAIAALYGIIPEEKFDNHGIGDDLKSLTIKRQDDKNNIYISISGKNKGMKGAQVDYSNVMMIASMFLTQFKKTTGSATNEEALAMIKHFVLKKHYKMNIK